MKHAGARGRRGRKYKTGTRARGRCANGRRSAPLAARPEGRPIETQSSPTSPTVAHSHRGRSNTEKLYTYSPIGCQSGCTFYCLLKLVRTTSFFHYVHFTSLTISTRCRELPCIACVLTHLSALYPSQLYVEQECLLSDNHTLLSQVLTEISHKRYAHRPS